MRLSAVIMIFAAMFFTAAFVCAGESEKLTVHLPRDAEAAGPTILLGQAVVMLGPEETVLKAGGVSLGRFASPGQVIRVDRRTILSMLAGAGIDGGQVRFSGSEFVEVRRKTLYVDGQRFAEVARAYIDKELSGSGVVRAEPSAQPQALALSEPNVPVELRAQGGRCQNPGFVQVTVAAYQGDKEVGKRAMSFVVRYGVKRAVAAADIPAGTVLGAEHIRIEEIESNRPQDEGWQNPVGLTARRMLNKGAIIHPGWVGAARSEVLIKRRQRVVLKIDSGLLYITATGEAMDEGRAGDVIRVRRGMRPDERIVTGTILDDGTVEPLI